MLFSIFRLLYPSSICQLSVDKGLELQQVSQNCHPDLTNEYLRKQGQSDKLRVLSFAQKKDIVLVFPN